MVGGQAALRGDGGAHGTSLMGTCCTGSPSHPGSPGCEAETPVACQLVEVTLCDYKTKDKLETCFSCDPNPVSVVEMGTGDTRRLTPCFW